MNFYEISIFMKNHIMLTSVWFLLLGIVLYTIIVYWIRKGFEISCNDAIFLINKKNAVVVDMRSENEFFSGYIINSVNMLLEDIKKDNAFFCRKFKDKPIIIVNNGSISLSYATRKYLNKLGLLEVYILQGGIIAWKDLGFPLLLKK